MIGDSTFGGLTKQYHVDVDPQKLDYYHVPLSALTGALANANISSGGNYLDVGEQAFDVRGLGFIETLDDIRNTLLSVNKSTPITVGNVAEVSVGYAPRLGIVGMNNRDEVSEGIALMRKYGNTLRTLRGVEAKVKQLNSSGMLPRGYKIVPYYDRTSLVETTLHTVMENLTIGMALVFLVLIFFLGNLKAAIIAAINIPLALCGAFILMKVSDTPANLISLGAIDFGIIIDTTVIVMENIHRHLSSDEFVHESPFGKILRAAQEVGGPMFFSTLIFVIAFLPLFTMRGVEGAIFSPDVAHLRLRAGQRHPAGRYAYAGAGLVRFRAGPARYQQSVVERDYAPLPRDVRGRPAMAAPDAGRWSWYWPRWRPRLIRAWAASSCPSSRRATSGRAPRCR